MAPIVRDPLAEVSPNKPRVGPKVTKPPVARLSTAMPNFGNEMLNLDDHLPPKYIMISSSPPRPLSREGRLASPVPLIPKSSDCRTETTSCKLAATRLKARLRLAYFKVKTNQTTIALSDLRTSQINDEEDKEDKPVDGRLSVTPTKRYNISSSPLKGPLLSSVVKRTPASMGAAKSLLKLGNF